MDFSYKNRDHFFKKVVHLFQAFGKVLAQRVWSSMMDRAPSLPQAVVKIRMDAFIKTSKQFV